MIKVSKSKNGIVIFDYITENIIYLNLYEDKILIKCDNIFSQIKLEKNRDKHLFKEFENLLEYSDNKIYDSCNDIFYQFNEKIIDKKQNKDLFKKYKNFINKMRNFNLYDYEIELEQFYLFISNVYYKKEVLGKKLILKNG